MSDDMGDREGTRAEADLLHGDIPVGLIPGVPLHKDD